MRLRFMTTSLSQKDLLHLRVAWTGPTLANWQRMVRKFLDTFELGSKRVLAGRMVFALEKQCPVTNITVVLPLEFSSPRAFVEDQSHVT